MSILESQDYMEVVLERDSVGEPWGLVWHVQGYKAQKLGNGSAKRQTA